MLDYEIYKNQNKLREKWPRERTQAEKQWNFWLPFIVNIAIYFIS